jgi:RHS repeat-associated protein
LDPATGLQNNLNRWYDPGAGRWLSEDPLGHPAGDANLYRYCGNSPSDRTDPTGMYWNWGNPFSGWMWNMWYYSDIDKERRQWILDHSTDASSLEDNLRRAQTPGPGEIATMRGLAEACVQFTAMAAAMASASNPLQRLPRVGSALKTDA